MKLVNWRAALYGVVRSASVAALLLVAAPSFAITLIVPNPPDEGTLFMQPRAGGGHELRWVKTGQADVDQKIVDKVEETGNPVHACKLVLQPRTGLGVGLMEIPEGVSGLTNGYIGIRTLPVCSEITGNEALTIALSGVLAGYQVFHTELNFRMKGASIARIDTTFDGQTRTFIFRTPGAVSPNPFPPGATIIDCVYHGTNLCRFVADDLWTSMTITTLLGKVAVDATSPSGLQSKFSLTKLDQTVDCDQNTVTATDPGGATVTGTRGQNADAGECEPVPYSLGWDGTDPENPVLVYSKPEVDQAVVTIFTITWPNRPVPSPGDNGVLGAVEVSQQQFVESEGFVPLDLCVVGTPVYEQPDPPNGPFVLVGINDIPPEADMSPSLPGIQFGCVVEDTKTYALEGTMGHKQIVFLIGDWKALRP